MSLTTSGLVAVATPPEKLGDDGVFARYKVDVVSQHTSDSERFDKHHMIVILRPADIPDFIEECKRPNIFLLSFGSLSTGPKGGTYITTYYPRDFRKLEKPLWQRKKKE